MEDIFFFGDGDSDFKGEDRELFSFHSISKVCNGMVNTSFKLVAVSIMMDNFRPNLNTNITSLSKGLSNCITELATSVFYLE